MQKSNIQTVLNEQPDEVDVDVFLEQVVLQQKIDAGEADVVAGRVTTHDDAKKRLDRWLA